MAKTKNKTQKELDLLKPVDIMQLGSDLDCFGKGYDLSTDECKRCGDSEFCAIATSHNLNIEREELEKKTEFKDLDKNPVEDFIKKKLMRGIPKKKIISRVKKRFGITQKECKELIKKCENE